MSVLCAHREDLESVALVLKKPLSLLRIVLSEWLVGYSRVGYSRLSYSCVGYSCVSNSCVGYSCGPIISAQDLSPKQTAACPFHTTTRASLPPRTTTLNAASTTAGTMSYIHVTHVLLIRDISHLVALYAPI